MSYSFCAIASLCSTFTFPGHARQIRRTVRMGLEVESGLLPSLIMQRLERNGIIYSLSLVIKSQPEMVVLKLVVPS